MNLKNDLFTTPDWPCGTEHVVLPWLRNVAIGAAGGSGVVAAIVPTRADAYFLKASALTAGLDLFGVHVMTPSEAREFLRQGLGIAQAAPSRAQLLFLLATAAGTVSEMAGDSEARQAAAAVAAAPDHLLSAVELLGAGGWDFAAVGPEPLRPIVREFERLLVLCGFQSGARLDAAIREAAGGRDPLFRSLLITGFDGAHWPGWPILAAATHSAHEGTILLREPQTAGADLDTTWIGTWEEEFGASESVAAEPSLALAQREFLAGADTLEQARAIVQKALQFLADPACERLGILLPGPGALARRVAESMAELEIPHLDSIAFVAPGPFESPEWRAWLVFQESPRLPTLLRFLEASPGAVGLFGGLSAAALAEQLRRTQTEILVDDLEVIAEWLSRHSKSRAAGALVTGLAQLTRLSEHHRATEFLAETRTAFADLGWTQHTAELQRMAEGWMESIDTPIPRRAWLRWLGDTLVSSRSSRSQPGNHPYGRTHLLSHKHAGVQTWTHLIVAGLNEGQWPPPFEEAGWIGEREIDELNHKVRRLNQTATVQGRQGEGHEVVAPGHALCLGPAQRRALSERDFFAVIETVTHAVAATVSLSDEAAPDRALNPGEFFHRLYHEATGRIISHDVLLVLQRQTAAWLTDSRLWQTSSVEPTASVAQTRVAYEARRRTSDPFGEYEFALREPVSEIRLSATDWERTLSQPSVVWMHALLGVGAVEEDADASLWNLAVGTWTHRWLGAMAPRRGGFFPRGDHSAGVARVMKAAENFQCDFERLLRDLDRQQPDWWTSVWQQAARITRALADRVGGEVDHSHIATEWTIPRTGIPLDASRLLHVRGRIDLLLSSAPAEGATFPDNVWIIDYKTGKKKSLAPKAGLDGTARCAALAARLRQGDGLQLALYGLAAHHLGATTPAVSLLTADLALDAPQLTLDDFSPVAQAQLWSGLYRMQETGIFGARGRLRDEFSFADPHPLATLAIDPEVLEEKWGLTHKDIVGVEEIEEGVE